MVKEMSRYIYNSEEIDSKDLKYGYVINSLDERVSDIVLKISENFSDKETGEILASVEKS